MRLNGVVPLSTTDIRRLLKYDRRLDHEMRDAIARSLTVDALAGLIPQRLRLAIAARRWPVVLVGTDLEG